MRDGTMATFLEVPSMANRLKFIAASLGATLALFLGTGCRSSVPWLYHPLGRGAEAGALGVVVVKPFTCADPIIAEAVQNIFLTSFADHAKEVVRDGTGDIVIEGTISMSYDAASQSGALVFGGTSGGESKSQSGQYVTGVTALLKNKSRIIAGASESQSRGERTSIIAPEALAQRAADRLIDELRRKELLEW